MTNKGNTRESKTPVYDALEPRQKRFVDQYLQSLNGTKAAIAAGYKTKNARVVASQNLAKPNIAGAIAEQVALNPGVTQTRVIDEIAKIAFSNARDYLRFNGHAVTLANSDELTDEQMAAVSSASQVDTKFGVSINIKLHDKLGALSQLRSVLGMDRSGLEHRREVGNGLAPAATGGVMLAPAVSSREEWEAQMRKDSEDQRRRDEAAVAEAQKRRKN